MYSIVGGVPFHTNSNGTLYSGIKVYTTFEEFEDIEENVKKYWDETNGLLTVLYNGHEMPYDSNLDYINPELI